MVLSLFINIISFPVKATEETKTDGVTSEETIEEIKARLVRQIRDEGWDPYSADMTIDEFYALMELFEEGVLPLDDTDEAASPEDEAQPDTKDDDAAAEKADAEADTYDAVGFVTPVINADTVASPNGAAKNMAVIADPGAAAAAETPSLIPSNMFLFAGLKDYNGDVNKPLDYDNAAGNGEDYPPGLDNYGYGYQLPPSSWQGIGITPSADTGSLRVTVFVRGLNAKDPTIAGDIKQELFLQYDGYYVRRVTAEGIETAVLGMLQKPNSDEFVYYYLSAEDQSAQVSTTTMSKGQKFIIQYMLREHPITYVIRMADGGTAPATITPDTVFGIDRFEGTVDGLLSFDVNAPYGYETRIYLEQSGKESERLYGVSGSKWPLGMEPIYDNVVGMKNLPNTEEGPASLVHNDTFQVDNIKSDSVIVAELTKKGTPIFNMFSLIDKSTGVHGRGTSGKLNVTLRDGTTVPYDYEDEYHFFMGEPSKYTGYVNGNWPNLQPRNNAWNWDTRDETTYSEMNLDPDGTYSYQLTFQTNTAGSNFLLDLLEVNGVGIKLPFYPKYVYSTHTGDEIPATGSGLRVCETTGTLPDGALVKVELLSVFGNTQRVYRITVTGASSNVTITGANLNMYSGGAPEISTYDLQGIYADFADGTKDVNQLPAIQYHNGSEWVREPAAAIIVSLIDYNNGDTRHNGANIRFKLADGYGSPQYLFESARDGTIKGSDGVTPQASVSRDDDTNIDPSSQNDILSMSDLSRDAKLDSQNIYDGGDGWYYIRLTGQRNWTKNSNYVVGLLTIVARPVKYVVRYMPNRLPEIVTTDSDGQELIIPEHDPVGMPEFTHADGFCHESFFDPNNPIPGEQYDDNSGYYYDTAVHTRATLSTQRPKDPDSYYEFVDWVLVDAYTNPVLADRSGKQMLSDINGNLILVDGSGNPVLLKNGSLTPDGNHIARLDKNGNAVLLDAEGNTISGESLVLLTRDGKLADTSGNLVLDGDEPEDEEEAAEYWKELTKNLYVSNSNGDPAAIGSYNEFHFSNTSINITDINEYAILNGELGGAETDVLVLRLMPKWNLIENPFHYDVVLKWIDANGNITSESFHEYWNQVLTRAPETEDGKLYVYLNRDADPLWNWLAMNPTYTFWTAVNNAADDEDTSAREDEIAIREALDDYIRRMEIELTAQQRQDILDALYKTGETESGEFTRLGQDAFSVNKDYGTIVVWMYELRGGLVFHKTVEKEPYIYDDEFYFTVTDVLVYQNDTNTDALLDGNYRAYPEHTWKYDENGKELFTDDDAWIVTYEKGRITNIVKKGEIADPDNPVTYFTLKNGEGIKLYIPEGEYTITEVGSKSGQLYRTYVDYKGAFHQGDKWDIPDLSRNRWLYGSETRYIGETMSNPDYDPDKPDDPANPPTIPDPDYSKVRDGSVSQVSATVDFKTGADEVVQTLTFYNITASTGIKKSVLGINDEHPYNGEQFQFTATITLPEGEEPMVYVNSDGSSLEYYYYFYANLYKSDGTATNCRLVVVEDPADSNIWVSHHLLIPKPLANGGTLWTKFMLKGNVETDGIWLAKDETLRIVMPVPTEGDITYVFKEVDIDPDWRAEDSDTVKGTVKPGHLLSSVSSIDDVITNVPYDMVPVEKLPAAGGLGTMMFYAEGLALLLAAAIFLRATSRRKQNLN